MSPLASATPTLIVAAIDVVPPQLTGSSHTARRSRSPSVRA